MTFEIQIPVPLWIKGNRSAAHDICEGKAFLYSVVVHNTVCGACLWQGYIFSLKECAAVHFHDSVVSMKALALFLQRRQRNDAFICIYNEQNVNMYFFSKNISLFYLLALLDIFKSRTQGYEENSTIILRKISWNFDPNSRICQLCNNYAKLCNCKYCRILSKKSLAYALSYVWNTRYYTARTVVLGFDLAIEYPKFERNIYVPS